ncbi:hypothetical protein SAMN04489762_2868 [Terribacillus saccharophilus]|uniref:Uncharacterized protein n=1 Tax=Terribacillus saccharophilus TaxID=361277 RepID=A0AAX2EI86_9BACI|nr:hypothetical protein SAMN04489762_2868 [Terribacillus saccharophilus]
MNDSNSEYDEETVSQAKDTAESYIKNNFEGIESIEMGEPYEAPMGSMTIDGTVNDGAGFSIKFHKDTSVAGIGTKEGFPELKDECEDTSCDY